MDRVDSLIQEINNHLDIIDNSIKKYYSGDTSTKENSINTIQREIQTIDQKLPTLRKLIKGSEESEEHEEDLKSINSDFESFKTKYMAIKNEFDSTKTYQQTNDKQKGALGNLKKAKADADDINSVLNQDLVTLEEDRETLQNINKNTNDIKDEADKGMTRAGRMLRRACFHKILSWIIVAVLAAVFVLILYLRFAKGKPLYCKHHKDSESCK